MFIDGRFLVHGAETPNSSWASNTPPSLKGRWGSLETLAAIFPWLFYCQAQWSMYSYVWSHLVVLCCFPSWTSRQHPAPSPWHIRLFSSQVRIMVFLNFRLSLSLPKGATQAIHKPAAHVLHVSVCWDQWDHGLFLWVLAISSGCWHLAFSFPFISVPGKNKLTMINKLLR